MTTNWLRISSESQSHASMRAIRLAEFSDTDAARKFKRPLWGDMGLGLYPTPPCATSLHTILRRVDRERLEALWAPGPSVSWGPPGRDVPLSLSNGALVLGPRYGKNTPCVKHVSLCPYDWGQPGNRVT